MTATTDLKRSVHSLKGEEEEERLGDVMLLHDSHGSLGEQVCGVVSYGRPVHLVVIPVQQQSEDVRLIEEMLDTLYGRRRRRGMSKMVRKIS